MPTKGKQFLQESASTMRLLVLFVQNQSNAYKRKAVSTGNNNEKLELITLE